MQRALPPEGVEILCIGTELLLGNILNSNAKWIAEELASIGTPHFLQSVVGDNSEHIQKIILEASNRSQIVITTGGLGPTPDDLTTEAITAAFKVKLVEKEEIIEEIKNKLKHSSKITSNNWKQALLPQEAEIIPNPLGTAPGIIWSPKNKFTIITLPGVPSEMKEMWEKTVKPWLISNYQSKGIFISKTINLVSISESYLVEKISDLINSTNPTVAPYASLGEVKLRITAQAKNNKEAMQLIYPIENEIIKRVGNNIYGTNNQTLSSIVIDLLTRKGETISLAESCTGGLLSAKLTSVPGSSKVFTGSVVAYNNSIKNKILGVPSDLLNKHGAVSETVTQSMAVGARKLFKSDWAISVSGIAGPSGSSIKKPIGLVEFCIANKDSVKTFYEKFGSHRERTEIQKLSVIKALDQLRLSLLNQSQCL